jgi:hypothetical protein
MNAESIPSLAELRFRAQRLLKDLRNGPPTAQTRAAERLMALRSFAGKSAPEIVDDRDRVRLKHALAVLAREHGHASWLDLKARASVGTESPPHRVDETTLMYDRGFDALLNRWFARYEDARASLDENGGYLLPYRTQFLICEEEAIRVLGLDPGDPDW